MTSPRPDFRVRIFRQGIRYLREHGWSDEAALLLAHLTEREYQEILFAAMDLEYNPHLEEIG
jgi:hypothetical protein